jgi:hypothetical protein
VQDYFEVMGSIFLAQIALVLCGITVTEVWMTFIS